MVDAMMSETTKIQILSEKTAKKFGYLAEEVKTFNQEI
jgi:hypothetical protein